MDIEKRKYFVISPASQDPNDSNLRIREINILSDEPEAEDFVNFEEYVEYVLSEAVAEENQHFLPAMVFTPEQIEQILKHFNK